MPNKLLTDQWLPTNYKNDGEILYGDDINNLIAILKEAINSLKKDMDTIVAGDSDVIVKYSVEALQEEVAVLDTIGYVYEDDGLKKYIRRATEWEFVKEISLSGLDIDLGALDTISFRTDTGLTQDDVTEPGTLFYDIERHTLTFLTDFGEYLEVGSNLGDFGKNVNGVTWEAQPVTIVGVQGHSPVKLFDLAYAGDIDRSTMVGVLTTSNNEDGSLDTNQFGKISVFGDTTVPDYSKILDSNFLSDLGVATYQDIPYGTKMYLSDVEYGKYSARVPQPPSTALWVATVISVNQNDSGRIFVNPLRVRSESSGIQFQTQDYFDEGTLFIDYDED